MSSDLNSIQSVSGILLQKCFSLNQLVVMEISWSLIESVKTYHCKVSAMAP